MNKPIPYGFDAIEPDKAIHDAPAWRDGNSSEQRLSGELLITLEALSPLIVGNQQHRLSDQKSELVPQMLDDGRVILGGTGLKGMLRSALASLLHAPMERVQEHHYTYRPNLGFGDKVELRAAIVENIDEKNKSVKISLLPFNSPITFIREEALSKFEGYEIGCLINETIKDIALIQKKNTKSSVRLDIKKGANENLDHYIFTYNGGIDGAGVLADLHAKENHSNLGKVYEYVLVNGVHYNRNREELVIQNKILDCYIKTQEILSDEIIGHLCNAHPLKKHLNKPESRRKIISLINSQSKLEKYQLIYVEISKSKKPVTILSMGHHFQYRWAYTSSVRHKKRLLDGQGQLRPELQNHSEEKASPDGSPQQLTAARLLFGYAIDTDNDELAKNHFKRLAGRISFNHAVEVPGQKTDVQRFVNAGQPITLKVLGQPRPSAVEFYLKQSKLPTHMTTYGDLPADPGGDLAGRKHYRHQPDARQNQRLYQAWVATGQANHQPQGNDEAAKRGTTVRYLNQPGSTFKTTLRFDSLRPWELGALLLALRPELAKDLKLDIAVHPQGYAHKLGYGKPLGLGSVCLKVDGARWQAADSWQWHQGKDQDASYSSLVQDCLTALKAKLQTTCGDVGMKNQLLAWLQPREWKNSGSATYPQLSDKKENSTIFNFHTDLRVRHAAARRGKQENFNDLQDLLRKKP